MINKNEGEAREGIIKITNALRESGRARRVFIRLLAFVLFFALYLKIFSTTHAREILPEKTMHYILNYGYTINVKCSFLKIKETKWKEDRAELVGRASIIQILET